MKLNVRERIEITNLFPQQHNIMTQTLVGDIGKKVRLSQKEADVIGLKRTTSDSAQLSWDAKLAEDVVIDVQFTKNELQFLKSQVAQYDEQNKITQGILSVCVKLQTATIGE